MYKEEFKLLYHTIEEEKVKEEAEGQKQPCKEESKDHIYKEEIERLENELENLKLTISRLEEERLSLLKEKKALAKALEERESLEKLIERLAAGIKEVIREGRAKIKDDVLELTVGILKKLLLTDILPKEEAILRALSKVIESGIDLKGQVNLYLNPKDLQKIGPYLEKLRKEVEDLLSLNAVAKEDIGEGEFLIETQKLWIERRYEDILQDILEDLRVDEGGF